MTDEINPNSQDVITKYTENFISKAEAAAARLEEASKRNEEILKRMENLEAKRILSGHSEAGVAPPPQVDPQTQIELEANKYFKQLSPYWKKHNK